MASSEKMIKNGKRPDGRKLDEMREMEAKAGVISRADGSGYFRTGKTRAIAAVYGPKELHPRHLQDPKKGYVKYVYNMAPFSTEERIRPGLSRRSTEISEVSRQAFNSVIFLKDFPKTGIEVHVEILQANAGTRCCAINAAAIALADAGIPMSDMLSSCAAGKVEDQIILDVAGKEDTEGQVDLPIVYLPRTDEIALLQMDGMCTVDEFKKAVEMAKDGCMKVHGVQNAALKERFEVDGNAD